MAKRDETPLFAGRIHGIRAWRLDWLRGDARLCGLTATPFWEIGAATEAECTHAGGRADHNAPVADCSCGLYALHPGCDQDAWHWLGGGFGSDQVVGVVEAWGRIEVHRDGFRAQYARPHAICLGSVGREGDRGRLLARLAERHGAELIAVTDRAGLRDHCVERGLGLDHAVVERLLPGPDHPAEAEVTTPTGSVHAPPSRGKRALELAGTALLGLLALAWYGFWAVAAVFLAIGFFKALFEEPAPEFTSAHVRVIDEELLSRGRELRYVAVVRNTSEKRAAVNLFAHGQIETAGGERVAKLGEHEDFDLRASLAPGETGVVIDDLRLQRGARAPDDPRFDTTTVARRAPERRRSALAVSGSRLAEQPCRVFAELRSTRPQPAVLAIVIRDRTGGIETAGWADFGRAGRDRDRAGFRLNAGECPQSWSSLELYPHRLPAQVG